MKIKEHSSNSHSFNLQTQNFEDKTVPLLLVSDVHFDSKDCDRELLKSHFDIIKQKGGYIMSFGDWFDVMGCHKDPRSKGQDVRPEYLRQDRGYLDLIVEDSLNFLEPYMENFIFHGYGNHETAIIKHRDTDILNTLCFLMRQKGSNVVKGGYSGFCNIKVFRSTSSYSTYLIAYHHGGGGNAPRSKGILHADIDVKNYPDANMIVSGHNHQKGYWPIVCYRRSELGKITHETKYWVKTGTYKRNDHLPLIGGWAVEKKFDPTPKGGFFLNLRMNRHNKSEGKTLTVEAELIDAK